MMYDDLAPMDDGQIELVTPVDIEQAMADLVRRIDNAPKVIKQYHEKVRQARQNYKRAYALAYAAAEGTQLDKKAAADLATEKEAELLDEAEIQYKYVIDTLNSLRAKLRALQSISSLMKASMFGPQGGV